MRYCLAIDIGASSGRHVVGWLEDGQLRTREVYRFPNGVKEENGRRIWDTEELFRHVKEGIRTAMEQFGNIASLSVDTWGVDYVLLREGKPLLPVYAYRDARAGAHAEAVHAAVPFEELYQRTGCQFQPFNSIYRLWSDKQSGRLAEADALLMLPEYLMYRLCGVMAREYTNATTTGLVNAALREYDREILEKLDLPVRLFPPLQQPGTVLGPLLPEIAREVGGSCKVMLCATHDTASAVEGIPMEEDAPYISSGTWSLLGVKVPQPLTDDGSRAANYSNEGGVGYIRYQKNIMGMWPINELKKELCPDVSFEDVTRAAQESSCGCRVDINDPAFLSPESMKAAFDGAVGGLQTPGDYFRCAFQSLAECYAGALRELEHNTGRQYEKLYIVGGGAKNQLLNHMTHEATGKTIIALPIEATALGNLKSQLEEDKI